MTYQDIVFFTTHLTLPVLLFGLLIIEIINTIRGKSFYSISLIKELKEMIIAIVQEIKGKQWQGKLNAMACLVPAIIILTILCFTIRLGLEDYTQTIMPFSIIVIFGFLLYWTFKASTNFLSGFH